MCVIRREVAPCRRRSVVRVENTRDSSPCITHATAAAARPCTIAEQISESENRKHQWKSRLCCCGNERRLQLLRGTKLPRYAVIMQPRRRQWRCLECSLHFLQQRAHHYLHHTHNRSAESLTKRRNVYLSKYWAPEIAGNSLNDIYLKFKNKYIYLIQTVQK